jgi:hypothetical protein
MVNQIISATRYNSLQGRIAAIVGQGSGDKGYGQNLNTSSVPVLDIVQVSHMNGLYNDFTNAYTHQTGSLPATISTVTTANEITEVLHQSYETLINTIETNRFDVHPTQADLENSGINSTRTTIWGGTALPQSIIHEFTVTFSSSSHRRHFFNAGGELRFAATLSLAVSSGHPDYNKTLDWRNMMLAMQTIVFNYTQTFSTNSSGTGSSIGNLDLTSSYQQIYRKTGSGVYADNEYTIQAKENSGNQIQFRITFFDANVGIGGADEAVNGTLVSTINQYRATGVYVEVPTPVYNLITTL